MEVFLLLLDELDDLAFVVIAKIMSQPSDAPPPRTSGPAGRLALA